MTCRSILRTKPEKMTEIQQESVYLSISLFCHQSTWNLLLKNSIKPFLIDSKKTILEFRIAFNYQGGENIRFSVKVKDKDKVLVTKRLHIFFNSHFRNLESCNPVPRQFVQTTVFKRFPPNSIHFGLYIPPRNRTKEYQTASMCLSRLIIYVLAEETISQESILTFSLYLSLIWIKSIKNRLAHKTMEMESRFLKEFNRFNPSAEDLLNLEDKWNQNKEILMQIIIEVYSGALYLDENLGNYFRDWQKICVSHASAEHNIVYPFEKSITTSPNTFNMLIEEQLGFNKSQTMLVNYFLINTIFLFDKSEPQHYE